MTFWKINDQAWQAKRAKEWKKYEQNIKSMHIYADDLDDLKSYFFTGEFLNEYKAPAKFLLPKLWLHPDNSVKEYRKIIDSSALENNSALNQVRARIVRSAPHRVKKYEGGSLLNGKDLNLYKAVVPERLDREFYSFMSEEKYMEFVSEQYKGGVWAFDNFFQENKPNENEYCRIIVPFWKDCLMLAFEETKELAWLIEDLKEVLSDETACSMKVELAKEIRDVLEDDELPDRAKETIRKLRKQVGW